MDIIEKTIKEQVIRPSDFTEEKIAEEITKNIDKYFMFDVKISHILDLFSFKIMDIKKNKYIDKDNLVYHICDNYLNKKMKLSRVNLKYISKICNKLIKLLGTDEKHLTINDFISKISILDNNDVFKLIEVYKRFLALIYFKNKL